jgi:hypothetical protein
MTDDERLSQVRMRIGIGAQGAMDVLDADVMKLLATVIVPLSELQRLLLERGVAQETRLNLYIAFAVAAALDENP